MFPSLSASNTGKAVRQQFEKSKIKWTNVSWKAVSLYVRLNDQYWTENELENVEIYLPKRLSNIGRPPSIGTVGVESRFKWPQYDMDYLPDAIKSSLMGFAIETAVVFFFKNFVYTFGGQKLGSVHLHLKLNVLVLVLSMNRNYL